MIDEKGALKAAEAAALEAIADGKNHWEVAHAVVEAYEAARSAEPVAWQGRSEDGQINSAEAIEWRQRVLAEGRLGLIDPAPTPSRSPEQPE